jgi:hypothetical protein
MKKKQIEIKENTFQLKVGDVELELTKAEMQYLYYQIKMVLNIKDDPITWPHPVAPHPVSPTDPWPQFPMNPLTPYCETKNIPQP